MDRGRKSVLRDKRMRKDVRDAAEANGLTIEVLARTGAIRRCMPLPQTRASACCPHNSHKGRIDNGGREENQERKTCAL